MGMLLKDVSDVSDVSDVVPPWLLDYSKTVSFFLSFGSAPLCSPRPLAAPSACVGRLE